MMRSALIFTCAMTALASAACGGSDTKTAQDPSMTTVTSAPTDPNLSAQPTTPSTTDSTSASPSSSMNGATNGTGDTAAKPSTTGASTNTAGSNGSATTGNSPSPSNNGTQMAPPAYGNPGSADNTKNADNTKINDRDRHGALTPVDQGNSSAETTITASIRKQVVGSKLSFTAKNVKIITTGTKVTLRGPVNSDQEKSQIETFARQTAGVSSVDNQLEIKK